MGSMSAWLPLSFLLLSKVLCSCNVAAPIHGGCFSVITDEFGVYCFSHAPIHIC